MGIPYVNSLRYDSDLGEKSLAWPFETGLKAITPPGPLGWRILHAEIYPSIVPFYVSDGQVRDEAQVQALAQYFAEADRTGELSQLFQGSQNLTSEQAQIVENEEGWILGVR